MPSNARLAKFQFLDLNLTSKDELLLADQKEFSEDSFSKKRESIPKLFDEGHEDKRSQSNYVTPNQVPFPPHYHSKTNSKKSNLDASFATLETSTISGTKDSSSENIYDGPMTSFNNSTKNDIDILQNRSMQKKMDLEAQKLKKSLDSCKEGAFAELANGVKYGSLDSGTNGVMSGSNNFIEENSNGIESQDINSKGLNIKNSG